MTDQKHSGGAALAAPPEGVIAGESVPRENEQEDIEEARIERVEAMLKSRGEPYTQMSDSELRERALRTARTLYGGER